MAPELLVEPIPDENGMSKGEKRNGEVVIGDMEHDGRVILYIIKGKHVRSESVCVSAS